MLSDAIREVRENAAGGVHGGRTLTGEEIAGMVETLRAWEVEARNMEERLAAVAGRQHAPMLPVDIADPKIALFPLPERPFGDG